MPKRVTSCGVHLHGLAPGQQSSEEMSQHWRAVGNFVSDLTGPGIESQTSRTDSVHLTTQLIGRLINIDGRVVWSVCLLSCRLGFDSESGQTNDFKIGIHSLPV